MAQIKMQAHSLCPWRSPVGIPGPSALIGEQGPREAPAALGPCLYLGCGLFKVTKVENGQVVDGMCSIRFAAEQIGSLAVMLERVVKKLVPGEDQKGS